MDRVCAAANSASQYTGSGTISRSETINMTMSAIVTDVLPNGHLAIRGRQEIRVNYELRELIVSGIIRPQDISRDNSIRHSQIAEARISYGGRGQLTQAQQARFEIPLPAIRVDDAPRGVLGHGIHGPVAALEVVLEPDLG